MSNTLTRPRALPSPLWGEGQGEGLRPQTDRQVAPHPNPLPRGERE
jgi:hypothetical protein